MTLVGTLDYLKGASLSLPRSAEPSPGSGKRHCDPCPDPKTAVAPLPRARSEPGGIFPTADFAPLHQQRPFTNHY
ncbi:MAG: hypothetical protein ACHBN1_34335 [Heteroscytonema crispum UTEX LB 1556]